MSDNYKKMKILSQNDLKLLEFINKYPGLCQTQIANKVSLSKSSISIFVKKARENNWINEIKKDRKINLHPTKLGKDIIFKYLLKNL